MRGSSGGTGDGTPGRNALHSLALLLAAVAGGAAVLAFTLSLSGPLRAQATRGGADNAPHFLRFGKTYVNLATVSHAVSDPGFGQPPGALQVYFGGQSYVNLYGEDADAMRRVLDAGTTPMTGGKTAATTAPTTAAPASPAATAPAASAPAPAAGASTKKPAPKKSVPRFEQP